LCVDASHRGRVGAWEEFVRRFHCLIATEVLCTAGRLVIRQSQPVDDLIQDTYLKLWADDFRLVRNFEQCHPDVFIGFVKLVSANVDPDSVMDL